jgi:uncharacterized protein with GYD domain
MDCTEILQIAIINKTIEEKLCSDMFLGKYSQDFLSGLIYNPQDRKKAAAAMMKKAGAEWAEGESYLYINHTNYDFVGIVYLKDESTMTASADMMGATGSFTDINFF